MKSRLVILVLTVFSSFNVFSQLEQIYVETIYHDGIEIPSLEGQTTYRVYAQMTDSTDWFTEISGDDICPLDISTTTEFFRSPAHGNLLLGSIATFLFGLPGFEELRYSSGLTIGALNDAHLGVPFSVNENGSVPSSNGPAVSVIHDSDDPWMIPFLSGGNINIGNFVGGAIFTFYAGYIQTHGPQNSVLIGQFTTDGVFSFNLNVQVLSIENGETTGFPYDWCDGIIPSLSYISSNCTVPSACNYNPFAEIDDGSCLYVADGCDDNNPDTYNDQITAFCECLGVPGGCTDEIACNYDADITVDDQSCIYPGHNCDDDNEFTINDVLQSDCSCAGELEGCNDPEALNFDITASEPCNGDNSCCIYIPENDFLVGAQQLEVSQPTACILTLGTTNYATDSPESENTTLDVWYEFTPDFECVIISAESENFDLVLSFYDNSTELIQQENIGTIGLEFIQYNVEIGETYYVNISAVDSEDSGNFTICVEESTLYGGLAVGCLISSCTDPDACNFDPEATEDNGTCYYEAQLCNDYDPSTINDVVQPDCTCEGDKLGCMDEAACNYVETAIIEDGSCLFTGNLCNDGEAQTLYDVITENCTCEGIFFESIPGCTDPSACNFNGIATESDGSCIYIGDSCDDSNPFTINDVYLSNCNCLGELEGCSDPLALNFDLTASEPCNGNNSCCVYFPENDLLENATLLTTYDNSACTLTSGTTLYASDSPGSVIEASDVWYEFTSDFECVLITAESNEINVVITLYDESMNLLEQQNNSSEGIEQIQYGVLPNELYIVNVSAISSSEEGDFTICIEKTSISDAIAFGCITSSCTDPLACNYDSEATVDNGSCYYAGDACSDYDLNTINDAVLDDCSCEGDQLGCMNQDACNYNEEAVIDNGSCFYIGDSCNDGLIQTTSDLITENCECVGIIVETIFGCTDVMACNFNPEANFNDGICLYTGDPCDDNNFATINETIQEDCSCFSPILLGCTDSEACNYNPIATQDNGQCTYPEMPCNDGNVYTIEDAYNDNCSCIGLVTGCMEETACNYNPNAQTVDWTCLYPGDDCNDYDSDTWFDTLNDECECIGIIHGCMDVTACNYNPLAGVSDGDCRYTGDFCGEFDTGVYSEDCECLYNLEGYMFIDANFNTLLDPGEIRIANHKVTAENNGLQVFTNSSGYFNVFGLSEGEESITADYQVVWEVFTTPQTQDYTLPETTLYDKRFGVNNIDLPIPTGNITVHEFYEIPCNDSKKYKLWYENTSPYLLDGYIEFKVNDLMSFNTSTLGADSIIDNNVYMSFSALQSYAQNSDDIWLNTPSELFFGDLIVQEINLYGGFEGEYYLVDTHYTDEGVTCAYDPNDITGIPHGYTEEHWVLEDTTMEYVIRFQNTGNAPATTVLVVDTLDEHMDFNSFQLRTYSHEVSASVSADGVASFLFENINLPDSTSNLEESQGSVSFEVDFVDGISIGEELNQTAYIYFDNNPPIITNTTWHTIHECGGEAAFETSVTEICAGEAVEFTSTYPHLEDYSWVIGINEESTEASFSKTFTDAGTYEVQFTGDNPLCSENTSETITVFAAPTVTISQNGALLTSSEGDAYQWFLNGEAIEGSTNQEYSVTEDGTYTVEVTNSNLCTGTSEGVMVVNISELQAETILLYPNPMEDRAFLEFEDASVRTIRLIDSSGKEVRVWNSIATPRIEISRGELAAGNYVITVETVGEIRNLQLLVK